MLIRSLLTPLRTMIVMSIFSILFAAGCGDDDSSAAPPSSSGGFGGSGGVGAASSMGGNGGASGGGGMVEAGTGASQMCRPSDHENDPCLMCLATYCCADLYSIGGAVQYDGDPFNTYIGYNQFFGCVRSCFDETDDAGAESPHDRLDTCGRQCRTGKYRINFSRFLSCASGGPQPTLIFDDAGVVTFLEGVPDEDGGVDEPNCLEACLPTW